MNEDLILEKLKNLESKMEDGFNHIIGRMDTANSKLLKHEGSIVELQKEDIRLGDKVKSGKGTWIIVTTLISVVMILIGRFVL